MKNNTIETTSTADRTECKDQLTLFQDLGSRKVVSDFSGGYLSSDGGVMLLRMIDLNLGLSRTIAGCFQDQRDQRYTEHSVEQMIGQRVYALALGYEDLNDHNELRRDPLLASATGKTDPKGTNRTHKRDQGQALAGASSLNRLELGNHKTSRAHKIQCSHQQLEQSLLNLGLSCLDKHSQELIVDFDATDDPTYGRQEGRFFHGYYRHYCYLPLYGFVGDIPLWAQLRTSDRDGADGTVEALEKIIPALRKRCPRARIIIRGDSGFCREKIMNWCEQNNVNYVLGLARNDRLSKSIEADMCRARQQQCLCGVPTRVYGEMNYRTRQSWSCSRRVISKAEVTLQGDNPRFIVTNLSPCTDPNRFAPQFLYEKLYCARGQMENVIKQQQLDLQADRTSTAYLQSNQIRLWFSTLGYLLLERLRHWGLADTFLQRAGVGTVRLKLLKIAAQVHVSVRRIHVRLSSAYPLKKLWSTCALRVQSMIPEIKSG